MKLCKKIVSIAVSSCFAMSLMAAPAFAAGEADAGYTYKVTLYSGTGHFANGDDRIEIEGHGYNDSVKTDGTEYLDTVVPADDRYTVTGIRKAGDDNANVFPSLADVTVTGDQQYIVTYGLTSNLVDYTVSYVDEAGNTLLPSVTYKGVPGNRPTVAYRYIERYLPNAYAMTGTLSKDAANEFTFVYREIPGDNFVTVEGPTVTDTVVVGGGAAPAAAAAGLAPGDAGAVADAAAAGELIDDDGNPLAAPEDLENIDDEETPLASGVDAEAASGEATSSSILTYVIAVVSAAALAAIIIALAVILRKRAKASK